MTKKTYTTVEADVTKETNKAFLISCVLANEELAQFWVPRSVIEDPDAIELRESQDINIETWWYKQKSDE